MQRIILLDLARVLRGGSWDLYLPDYFRCALRDYFTPDYRYYFGFRCARTITSCNVIRRN